MNKIVDSPSSPQFQLLSARQSSFKLFPGSAKPNVNDLATAGFFYTGKDDDVECFWCAGKLSGWEEGDDPNTEHAM